ncbi:MAG: uroporphyrinogen decarboxylase family protein [Chloroflexota bacterium]|nr:uroporphyrinogen decarboxylase family protein [Chloroflexota bacterium]
MANPTLEMLHGVLYGNGLRIGRLSPTGRVVAALMGKHGDTVPFMGPQIHDHAMTVAKVPARKYYWDARLLVDVQLAVERWYNCDSYTIVADAYNFEVEALGAKMVYSDHAMPTVDTSEPIIKERADLDKLGPLDLSKGRIPMGVEAARLISEKASGPFAMGFFCAPFSFLCQAMGYPNVVRALRRDRVFAQELFDYAENEAIFPYLKAQSEQPGVKQTAGADAWACFPNLPPDMVEEWVVPSAERMKEKGKRELGITVMAGLAAADYCEEDPAKFDKEIMFKCWSAARKTFIMDVAFSLMGRTQDWNMEWLQEFAVQNGSSRRKLPIYASLNGRFVRDSTPEQIVNKIREWIDIMGRDGRLLFFIGNVPADAPPTNVHTAVHAVHTLGHYPIAKNLSSIEVRPPAFQPFDEWLKGQPEADIIFKAREG